MATALPAVELFSTSILSNHAVRKKHERYTSVLSIKKIPYVYHDMAMDEEAKKRWRAKARDQAIPGLLVHNEWRGTFAEFDEAVEFDELDMFLAIDHERLKREQALLAGNGNSSNGDGDSAASTSGVDAAGAPAESGSNGTANGNAGGAPSATTTKYTGEAPPPFAPEGTGKRRSLDADDFLKALGIDESSLDVNDADLADMLNDSSLRSTNQATVETLRAGATSEGSSKHAEPVPVPLNGLKGNAALGIGAAAAVRNAERKAQRGVVDGEKLKMDGLGPLAEGAPVELFTTSLLSNTGVRERHERFMHVLTSNQIHFRKYDLIADESAKKRWRAKSRDPQLPGVLVHGEWRGSYADFDAAARQGPDALVQWLNIDARLANASVLAAREASSGNSNEEEEEADALAPKLNSNRFSLAIDDFLASLGVADLTLGDADVDELLNGSGVPVVPGGEGAPVPPLRAAIPIQEREVIKEEDEEEEEVEVDKEKGGEDASEAEGAVVEEEKVQEEKEEEAMPEGDKAAEEPKEEAVPEEAAKDEVKTEEKAEDIADVEETPAEKEETSEAVGIKEEPESAVDKVEESESAAVPTQEVPEEEEKEIDAVASTSAAELSAPAVEAVEATASPEAEASEEVTSALLPATEEDEAVEKIEASDPTEPEPAETEVKATEPEVVEEAPVAEAEPPSDVKPEEPEPEAAGEAKAETEEPPPPPEKESEPSSSSPTTETTPVTSPGATMRKPRKSKSRTAVTDVMQETDEFSPGRRGMDYQRPSMFDLPEPSPSMPFLSAGGPTSPILSDGGKNGASAMARSASAMSGLSGGKEARNRSGSGSAKRGLTSRLKFGKDKDKDRDKAPPGSPGLDESENGNGGGLASPLRARLSRDGSSGGIFKSRSRSPGPSSSKFKAKDRDVRGGPGGNAPPVPAMPRLVSGSVRAERTLSQILRDADAAMQMADAQMKGGDDEEDGGDGVGGVEGDGLEEGSADEGDGSGDDEGADGASKAPDPFGKDQVTVDARS